jgi:hypothetical protein
MRWRSAMPWVFPVLLWLACTFFFAGDLGQWNDDYAYDLRDWATLEAPAWYGARQTPYFWRPLYHVTVPPLQTALAEHNWINHAINAAAHGVVALLVWFLARALGLPWRGAAGAGLLFLAYPGAWEAPLWPSALPTVASAGVALAVAILFLAFVRERVGWWVLAPLALLAFVIPCFNEQAATVAAALPVLAWSAGAPVFGRRSVAGTAVCLLAVAAYVALYVWTAPPGLRGSSGSFTPPDALYDKLLLTIDRVRAFTLMENGFVPGALVNGARTVAAAPVRATFLAIGLALGAAFWLLHWLSAEGNGRALAMLRAIAAGAAIFITGWLPVLMIRTQGVEPRLCYWPMVGLAIMIGGAAAMVAAISGDRLAGRLVGGVVFAAAACAGMVMMIGIQGALRSRWLLDQRESAELRTLLPSPAPGSIFIPVQIDDRATSTGYDRFDLYFCGPLERPWSAPAYLGHAYRRHGLVVGRWNRWPGPRPVMRADPRGLGYEERSPDPRDALPGEYERDSRGAKILAWEKVVPFVIDGDGRVRLVSAWIEEDASGNEAVFPIVQARARVSGVGEALVVRRKTGAAALTIERLPTP